jgi:hypothetical protein
MAAEERNGTELRITSVVCYLCKQPIKIQRLLEWGLDAQALCRELTGRNPCPLQLNQLRRRLEQHHEQHQCCGRGHDCESASTLKPAWYPW